MELTVAALYKKCFDIRTGSGSDRPVDSTESGPYRFVIE